MVHVVFLPVVKEARQLYKSHQNHEPHVGLEFLNRDLRPVGELLISHALQSELDALLDDVAHQGWSEEE